MYDSCLVAYAHLANVAVNGCVLFVTRGQCRECALGAAILQDDAGTDICDDASSFADDGDEELHTQKQKAERMGAANALTSTGTQANRKGCINSDTQNLTSMILDDKNTSRGSHEVNQHRMVKRRSLTWFEDDMGVHTRKAQPWLGAPTNT